MPYPRQRWLHLGHDLESHRKVAQGGEQEHAVRFYLRVCLQLLNGLTRKNTTLVCQADSLSLERAGDLSQHKLCQGVQGDILLSCILIVNSPTQ